MSAQRQTFYEGCQVPSKFFSDSLTYPLSSHVRQVVIFIVTLMVSPHHKNDLEPLCSEGSERLMMVMAFSSLIPIISVRPFTALQRIKCEPVQRMAQPLLTRVSKLHDTAFTAGLRHRHRSRLSLKMSGGLPTVFCISQLSPNSRDRAARFCAGQRLGNFSRRHSAEKIFDLSAIAVHCFYRGLQLNHKRQKQFRFRSNHMGRNGDLRLMELIPKLVRVGYAQVMVAFGKAIPAPSPQIGERLRGGIRFKKI